MLKKKTLPQILKMYLCFYKICTKDIFVVHTKKSAKRSGKVSNYISYKFRDFSIKLIVCASRLMKHYTLKFNIVSRKYFLRDGGVLQTSFINLTRKKRFYSTPYDHSEHT